MFDLKCLYEKCPEPLLLAFFFLMQLYLQFNTYTTYCTNITLTFTLTIYLLIILLILTLLIHALLYNTILKQLKEIRNYLQYDTNATKKDTSTTIQILTD